MRRTNVIRGAHFLIPRSLWSSEWLRSFVYWPLGRPLVQAVHQASFASWKPSSRISLGPRHRVPDQIGQFSRVCFNVCRSGQVQQHAEWRSVCIHTLSGAARELRRGSRGREAVPWDVEAAAYEQVRWQ